MILLELNILSPLYLMISDVSVTLSRSQEHRKSTSDSSNIYVEKSVRQARKRINIGNRHQNTFQSQHLFLLIMIIADGLFFLPGWPQSLRLTTYPCLFAFYVSGQRAHDAV
jgi:hypothetical protein